MKEVIGRPIAFASTGEKLADFEPFHPDRMAGRILGMGDVLTLIEKAEQAYDQDEAEAGGRPSCSRASFTLEDFLEQMQQVKKMGPARQNLVGMLPGHPQGAEERRDRRPGDRPGRGDHPVDDPRGAARTPSSSNGSRRLRIANGSGTTHHRGQPAAQAVQGDAEDDEAMNVPGGKAQGQEGQEGRPGDGQGRVPADRSRPELQLPGLN